MKKQWLILLAIFASFSSCYKASDDDLPIIIRLENRTGKNIAAATFFSIQPNNRNSFEYTHFDLNGFSEYVIQTETNFSIPITIEYADGSQTKVEHPWWGNEFGRMKPDAGKYTYRLVAANGNQFNLIVQSSRD